jgi:hypothetical protein
VCAWSSATRGCTIHESNSSGTLMTNSERQPKCEVIHEPSAGPTAAAPPSTEPMMPNARARRSGGEAIRTSAIAVGMISAPPAAISSRPATTTGNEGASMPAAAPTPNVQRPHVSVRA